MDLRLAPGADVHAEIEVRRSRFCAVLRRVTDEGAARAVVAEVRRHRPDARHHCSAFLLTVPGGTPVERSSDDGEPPGTAGMPMLEVLRGSGLSDVVAVVSRYFGGVKLGTGGLVRAYSQAVRAALDSAPVVRPQRLGLWEVELPHADAGRVEAELRDRGIGVHQVRYGRAVTVTVAAHDDEAVGSVLAALTAGAAQVRAAGQTMVEHPVRW